LSKKEKNERKKKDYCVWLALPLQHVFVTYCCHHRTVGGKIAHAAFHLRFRHRSLLLLLCSRCRYRFFFDFFMLCPSLAMSGAFQWHQLSWLVPSMRLHIRGIRLWDFFMGELPCLPHPSALDVTTIIEKTTAAEKEKFLANYEDRLASYKSQFHAYRTWLDEDARAFLVLAASMEDRFAADIVEFEQIHQI
jgi:hypothetical protein